MSKPEADAGAKSEGALASLVAALDHGSSDDDRSSRSEAPDQMERKQYLRF